MPYNYGTSESTNNWNTPSSSDASTALFSEPNALIPQFGCGTDGDNTFSLFIKTSSSEENGSFSRESAWRKAYRFLNRFDTVDINMDRFIVIGTGTDGSATYNAQRSVFKTNPNYETPFDHKSPCRFPFNKFSNPSMEGDTAPLIEILYSMSRKTIDTPADGWDGNLTDENSVQWAIGSKGLGLRTNTTPEAMEFPLLKTNVGGNFKIDTSRSVIPAYSGEILSFRGDLNSDGDNLGLGYMGNTDDGSIIYINITETDEVLRWDPDPDGADVGIKPEDWWIKTISGIQVKNSDRPKSGFVNFKKGTMTVVSNDKNNYVVSFTSPKQFPLSSWGNGQNIRVQLKRKKIIRLDDDRKPWGGAEYENIRYRRLEDEFRDDVFSQVPIEPPDPLTGACCTDGVCEQKTEVDCSTGGGEFFGVGSTTCTDCDDDDGDGGGGQQSSDILPFTTALSGRLDDGSVIINYPDGFDATGIKFEVYIEKDPPAS